ncbi:MAG: universal stress protein [Haloferacaceae archaeon]|jgi:nucleotide-binding universal stress UspA family protein
MYDNILYPVDGSDGAVAAIDNVEDLARTYDAVVHVLFVAEHPELHGLAGDVDTPDAPGMGGEPEGSTTGMRGSGTGTEEIQSKAEAKGQSAVTEVADRLDGVETQTAVLGGTPHEVILEYADQHDADIVVMGTHGRTGLDRYLLGSVTEKVVRLSDVPVMTVRRSEADE